MWLMGYFHVNNAVIVCELGHGVFQFFFYLQVQGTSYINSQHKEVWINHFVLNMGFVRRGMYIL